MNSDWDNEHQITDMGAGRMAWNPSLSLDGNKIAFEAHRSDLPSANSIDVINIDSSGQTTVITQSPQTTVTGPAFSPDGQKIAFTSTFPGNYEIYVIDIDGSNLVNLTNTPTWYEEAPSWSPDGERITFGSSRDGNAEIYIMDADGSNTIRLTNDSASDWNPVWSPDGVKIAYTSSQDGHAQIYVMNADGSNQVNISNNSESDSGPSWSTDGTKIAFSSMRDDATWGGFIA